MNQREALDFLSRMAGGIAKMFGSFCETVIHDLRDPDHPVVAIHNGHVTKRKTGDSLLLLGVNEVSDFLLGRDFINCEGRTADGRMIKSTTFHLKGRGYHYALGINFDCTHLVLARTALEDLTRVGQPIEELLARSGGDILDVMFEDCLKAIGKPVAMLHRDDRRQVVEMLKEKGAFDIQKSIPVIAGKLNVSRYTVYKYLKDS